MQLVSFLHKPLYQGLLFLSLTLVITFSVRPKNADQVWVISGLTYALFLLANAVLAFWAVEIWPYFFVSLGCSLLYLVSVALIAKILMNLLRLEGPEESAMIFTVVIFHPVALLLSFALKWTVLKLL